MNADLNKILSKVTSLPALPEAVQKLYQLAGNTNVDIREMSKVISNDQALTSKVLRVVNSSFYGLSQKVGSVTQALVILGFNEVRHLALSLSVIKIGKNMGGASVIQPEDFWRHSISTAICTRILATKFHLPDPEVAFVSGLLHDMGKLIFMEHFFKEYNELLKNREASTKPLMKSEEEHFKINHADLGYEICRYWKLPPVICHSIQKHHGDISQMDPKDDRTIMTFLVAAGNNIAKAAHIGSSGDNLIEDAIFSSERFPLKSDDIKNIMLTLEEEVDKVEESFELKKRESR